MMTEREYLLARDVFMMIAARFLDEFIDEIHAYHVENGLPFDAADAALSLWEMLRDGCYE